ncbi:MAG: LPS-assembly protein LptD [Thalassovita sp.]
MLSRLFTRSFSSLAVSTLSLSTLALTSLAVVVPQGPALAQSAPQVQPAQSKDAVLIADNLQLDGRDRLVAEGHVEAYFDTMRLKAKRIVFDRKENRLYLEGPLVLTQGSETIILADAGELDPRFENGLLLGARLILNQQVQLAANQLGRVDGRYTQLYKVAATSCRVCETGRPPLWQIRAQKTTHDSEEKQLYFENAQLRVMDVPILWLPRLRLPDPSLDRATGFLIPSLKQNSQLGVGVRIPYFIRMGDHRDLTFTPYLSANTRTLELRYRQAFHNGRITFEGAMSDDNLQPGSARGYLFGSGDFDLKNDYKLSFDIEAVTDRSYLVDYDFSSKDRLKSEAVLSKVTRDSYTAGSLISYQTLRDGEVNATLPTIIADVDYERRYHPDLIGGEVQLAFGAHSHHRYSDLDIVGRDVTRINAELGWTRDFVLPAGLLASYNAKVAFDGYNIHQDSSSTSQATVVTPQTNITLRWPLTKTTKSGATHILEPVASLGWVGGSNANVPNDESTQVEFDEGNLLDLSHFAEEDRRERGQIAAAGLFWSRLGPKGGQHTLAFGQVFREIPNADFSTSSGLSGSTSDVLVAGQFQSPNGLSLSARTLLQDGKFEVSKAEARARWTLDKGALGASYVWLGADAAEGRSATISEWRLDGQYRMSRHWTGTMDWRYDVVGDTIAEAGLGVIYRNECVQMRLSLSRRFTSSTIVEPSTSLAFFVNLTGFSATDTDTSYTRSCRN